MVVFSQSCSPGASVSMSVCSVDSVSTSAHPCEWHPEGGSPCFWLLCVCGCSLFWRTTLCHLMHIQTDFVSDIICCWTVLVETVQQVKHMISWAEGAGPRSSSQSVPRPSGGQQALSRTAAVSSLDFTELTWSCLTSGSGHCSSTTGGKLWPTGACSSASVCASHFWDPPSSTWDVRPSPACSSSPGSSYPSSSSCWWAAPWEDSIRKREWCQWGRGGISAVTTGSHPQLIGMRAWCHSDGEHSGNLTLYLVSTLTFV